LKDLRVDGRIILKISLKSGWEDVDFIYYCEESYSWWAVVNTVSELPGSIKCGELLN